MNEETQYAGNGSAPREIDTINSPNKSSDKTSDNGADNHKGGYNGGPNRSTNRIVSQLKYKEENNGSSRFVEVEFKSKKKELYRNNGDYEIRETDFVIVPVDNGIDIGEVTAVGKKAEDRLRCCHDNRPPAREFLRAANDRDLETDKANVDEISAVVSQAKELVERHGLAMKVTDADWQFDRRRLTIFFTAPQRVDFRELVKDLAKTFRTRIELRQISSREEAKRLGGIGSCGLKICCSTFVSDFCHVTLDHARMQQLSNNPAKLSGFCGRLKCCLLYEYEVYEQEFRKYPPLNSTILYPEGAARIVKVDVFKSSIIVHIPDAGTYKTITLEELFSLDKEGKVKRPSGSERDPAPVEIDCEESRN